MILQFGETRELRELQSLLLQIGAQMNALQTAVSALQADVTALSAAVTASQANQFTAADVANIQTIDGQVKTLTASLSPAPTPTPSAPTS
jgi:type VI protein secretion system component VasF